jgi:hypothetical protein
MNPKLTSMLIACLLLFTSATAQNSIKHFAIVPEKRSLVVKRITDHIKIDGLLDEAAWQTAPEANKFIGLRPTPFKAENPDNPSRVFIMYNNEGIYVGGILTEKNKDSISSELMGRDGFGSNDFLGVVFDTYQDKLNAFEYFVTPLGEQFDAKVSPNTNGNSEDFSWNAVWQSAAKINNNGWTFEMFIPFSAIRFGKKKIQDWGLNIVRKRQKCGEQMFWQPIDPTVNGFLTQEGTLKGLEDLKPPLRLQFSPYFSVYYINDASAPTGVSKTKTQLNGGMDVKYGINQAFTLDMTLIPDFGQVQSDNRTLNLSPFEQKFNENRAFFTEGTELFNKGNLFYSRRIGTEPRYHSPLSIPGSDSLIENPSQAKIVNATKISGRTQKGLGIGILNAITKPQNALLMNKQTGDRYTLENQPLTNYNIFVLNQTLKHNSSVSLVNTNVLRSGSNYDANVSAVLFDFFDKTNTWNIGGNVGSSALLNKNGKNVMGYAHSLYFSKVSGRFNFTIQQDLANDKYDKSDMGYFTNNNSMDNYMWMGYNWTKPKGWHNSMYLNFNLNYSRLVTPIDLYKGGARMFQSVGGNMNVNGTTKHLWGYGLWVGVNGDYNDFYEPRDPGRVFHNKGNWGVNIWWNNNQAKKLSWGGSIYTGQGGVFKRTSFDYSLFGKIRFNSKFSVDHSININNAWNQPGWASTYKDPQGRSPLYYDSVFFSRRNVMSAENILNFKYNFSNKMGLTLRMRHYWSKVDPKQFYLLNVMGDLVPTTFNKNVNQNYNYFSTDALFTWEFTKGSFVYLSWKDLSETFERNFQENYFKNLSNTTSAPQANSFSVKVIYFLDYLDAKRKLSKH